MVKVWDPTDKSYIPRGKQIQKPHGIWYTAVTGIWQTVWLEPVAQSHISAVKTTPDIDDKLLKIKVCSNDSDAVARIEVFDGKIALRQSPHLLERKLKSQYRRPSCGRQTRRFFTT